jgi:D-proline reductase (dithiol) PrdB
VRSSNFTHGASGGCSSGTTEISTIGNADSRTEHRRFSHSAPQKWLTTVIVAYPRDRLVELEQEGVIGRLAPKAVSMLGSITTYTELGEKSIPVIADTFKDRDADLVLLVPFCPACHRATSLVAKGLEARGIPCVMLTVLREMAEAFKPARPIFLDYPLGATAGRPNDPADQRAVLREALTVGAAMAGPWAIHDLPFAWSEDGSRSWEDDVREIYAVHGKDIHRARVAEHTASGEKLAGQEERIAVACAC